MHVSYLCKCINIQIAPTFMYCIFSSWFSSCHEIVKNTGRETKHYSIRFHQALNETAVVKNYEMYGTGHRAHNWLLSSKTDRRLNVSIWFDVYMDPAILPSQSVSIIASMFGSQLSIRGSDRNWSQMTIRFRQCFLTVTARIPTTDGSNVDAVLWISVWLKTNFGRWLEQFLALFL